MSRRAVAFLLKDRITASAGFNRWWIPLISVALHLCIGSVYSWSIFNPALTRELGVAASSADDWSITVIVGVFSTAIVFLGLSTAVAGKWLEDVGPRCAGVCAAGLWGMGFVIGGVGIELHELWLLYLGYGVLGGAGLGLGYISPVSTLIRWFPDRRGLSTGLAIMGFGGGAIIAAPLKKFLLQTFHEAPRYLGATEAVDLVTERGRQFAEVAGEWLEVVVAAPADVSRMIVPGPEGVYVVGTGSTGAALTFFTLGLLYFCVMLAASFSFRLPREGWKPAGWDEDAARAAGKPGSGWRGMPSTRYVPVQRAHRTPQFYLLWIMLCFNVTAGIGVIGVAETMMVDIFGPPLPHVVTPAFAVTYVLMISIFNMGGRLAWATASDYIGRRNTYHCFFALGAALYCSVPLIANAGSVSANAGWLVAFYAVTMVAFTMYGGGFATLPAYLADVFGTRHVGAIHGRLLTAWSVAGALGPLLITQLREFSLERAIRTLADRIDPAAFEAHFGAPMNNLNELVAANTVTISRLMEIAPAGTADPTPGIYNLTMYVMGVLLAIALLANMRMRPVAERFVTQDYSRITAESARR
ncbi:MAG: OFA family MFS transporter [Gammaproteobacteria bacterium]|nr:OFA family MFS transporter [Gammaproteobacteria bacterium]